MKDGSKQLQIRRMELSHMDSLMQLKNAEGWNQLEEDWSLLITYRESVNLVADLDDRIVGSVTALNYAGTLAWIGMMLVDKGNRGLGIGKRLMLELMDKLEGSASIKLDATPAGRPLYLKLGFRDEYELYRMTNLSVSAISSGENSIVPMKMQVADLPEVAAFDRQVFGADRTELITRLFERSPELAWIVREKGRLAGFCLGRPGQNFIQIGPVQAESEGHAKALIGSAVKQVPGRAVVVDIPAEKTATIQWLKASGFQVQRPFERMYLHENPHPGMIENLYLIAGPELG
jgi:GNAT superfamily N-acetyltransferase